MGTARDYVADEVVTLVGDMEITEEEEMREAEMVTTTTPPHQDWQKMRGGGQNCRKGGRLA